jgi:hypothetical protein
MGLDVVELVMEIEEHFSVTIPDENAGQILCVGDLYLFLLRQTRRGRALVPCPTAHAFYRIRRELLHEVGVERHRVRPTSLLRDLIPAETRESACPRLATALGLPSIPDPEPPWTGPTRRGFRRALSVATVGTSVFWAVLCLLAGKVGPLELLIFLKVFVLLAVCAFFAALWSEARAQQGRLPVVRDLVIRLAPQCTLAPSGELWDELVAFLSLYFRVPPEEVQPERRWEELGRRWGGL